MKWKLLEMQIEKKRNANRDLKKFSCFFYFLFWNSYGFTRLQINVQKVPVYASILTTCITIVQYQNQEINIGVTHKTRRNYL